MKPWMAAVVSGGAELKSRTFTSNETFVVPVGVTQLQSIVGKGQDGFAGSSGSRTTAVNEVVTSASGTGVNSGSFTWNDFQGDAESIASAINAGSASGIITGVTYTGYPNSNTYTTSIVQRVYQDAVSGTAFASFSAGWKSSGVIQVGDGGTSYVNYDYFVAPTTGASASGFGKTFPGGAGGPAVVTSFGVTAVTPGAPYSVIVPAGGSITITYYQ